MRAPALLVLAILGPACAPQAPAGTAATSDRAAPAAPAPAPAPALLRVTLAEPVAAGAAPAPEPEPGLDLASFCQRLARGDATPIRIAHEDALRIFARAREVDWEGIYADHGFGDLCGDPAPELLVEISEGWKGAWRHDLVFEGSAARGWTLRAGLRRDATCNGPTAPRVLADGDRRLLLVAGSFGTGTGIVSGEDALLELRDSTLTEVARWLSFLEIGGWGAGVWISGSVAAVRLGSDGAAGLLIHLDWTGSAGLDAEIPEDDLVDLSLAIRFRQAAPGAPATLEQPAGFDVDPYAVLYAAGARAWLAAHETLAWELVRRGDDQQREALRRLTAQAMPDPRAAPLLVQWGAESASGS